MSAQIIKLDKPLTNRGKVAVPEEQVKQFLAALEKAGPEEAVIIASGDTAEDVPELRRYLAAVANRLTKANTPVSTSVREISGKFYALAAKKGE